MKRKRIILVIIMIVCMLNVTIVNATGDTIISWQQEDYWEWHTRTTTDDQAYNGNHIVINRY